MLMVGVSYPLPLCILMITILMQALIPLVVTIAGVLDAIPLDVGDHDAKEGATLAFDAVATFAEMSELEATAYVRVSPRGLRMR